MFLKVAKRDGNGKHCHYEINLAQLKLFVSLQANSDINMNYILVIVYLPNNIVWHSMTYNETTKQNICRRPDVKVKS